MNTDDLKNSLITKTKPLIDPKQYKQLRDLLGTPWRSCFTEDGVCVLHKENGMLCGKAMSKTTSPHSLMKHIYSFHYFEYVERSIREQNNPSPVKKLSKPKKRISKNKNCAYSPELIQSIIESIKTNPGLVKNEQLLELSEFFNQQVKLIGSVPSMLRDEPESSADETLSKTTDDELALGTPEEKIELPPIVETPCNVEATSTEQFVFDDSKRRSIWSL